MAEQNTVDLTSGNISDFNKNGIYLVHLDKDHNPNATDYPFDYGDMIHAMFKGSDGNTYRIMVAIDLAGTTKIGWQWGKNASIAWKTVTTSV